jgi:hypothetical protein
MSRSQVHHSGGIRVDPPRVGMAASRRPGGSLRAWVGDDLDAYVGGLVGRHLAVLDGVEGGDEEDGWASSFVRRVGEREPDGSYLVSTERSRYRVTRVG